MLKNIWGKFAYYTFIGILIIVGLFCGKLYIKASTLTPYDTYWQQEEDNNFSSMGRSGKFTCMIVEPGVSSIGPFSYGTLGTTYTSNAYMFDFAFNSSLTALKYYDIVITNTKSTFKTNINTNNVSFYNGTSVANLYDPDNSNAISLVSVTRNSGSKITIRIYVSRATSLWALRISYPGSNITSGTQWGINTMSITEVDMSNTNAILDNATSNTNSIINNQNSNNQNLLDNQNNNTQSIIDNQNQNSQETNNIINNQLGNLCANLFDKSTMVYSTHAYLPGNVNDTQLKSASSNFIGGVIVIKLQSGKTYTVSKQAGGRLRIGFTNSSSPSFNTDNVITRISTSDTATSKSFQVPSGKEYAVINFYSQDQTADTNVGYDTMLNSIMINEGSSSKPYCEFGSYSSKLDDTNNSINNVNNSINNDDIDNPSSFIEDMEDLLPHNGVITNLITLPIQLFTKVLNSINGTCQSFSLGNLYGTNLIMPCIEVSNYLGSTLWNTIDLIISGVFVLTIAKKMIKAFESFTGMKEGDVIND